MTSAFRYPSVPNIFWKSCNLLTAAVLLLLLAGCAGRPNVTAVPMGTPERGKELLALAAREAALIEDLNIRLTRQLNIASLQIEARNPKPAVTTLRDAMATLSLPQAAKAMNDHTRMSGWVSVSELARQCQDSTVASAACDSAEATLRAIALPADRCQYVMGLANEFNHLRGPAAAGNLLVEGAKWAHEIDSADERRKAVFAFSVALFNMDQYESGLAALKNEPDATWRSDKLVELSRPMVAGAPTASSKVQMLDYVTQQSNFYGKRLEFNTNFQGANAPRTTPQGQQAPESK